MRNVLQKAVTATAAVLLALTFGAAQAATKADVAKARAACASHKQKVLGLEHKSSKGDALKAERTAWESSCQEAEVLINQVNGTQPPKVVTPKS